LRSQRLTFDLRVGRWSFRELACETWSKIVEHEILTRAAAVAFYAMMAFIPFLALIVTLIVQLLPDLSAASRNEVGIGNLTVAELRTTLKELFPPEAYDVVADQITRLQKEPPVGMLSLGLAILFWTASSLFLAIIDALNRIYGVVENRPFWKLRLTAMLLTLVQAVLLIGSLLVIVIYPVIVRWAGLTLRVALVAGAVQLLVVFVMVLLSFALTFAFGPAARRRWVWITPGSLAGTLVFLLMSYLFRYYISHFADYDRTYGALGGVMMLMLWFWMSSLVLLAAGEMNGLVELDLLQRKPEDWKTPTSAGVHGSNMPVEPSLPPRDTAADPPQARRACHPPETP